MPTTAGSPAPRPNLRFCLSACYTRGLHLDVWFGLIAQTTELSFAERSKQQTLFFAFLCGFIEKNETNKNFFWKLGIMPPILSSRFFSKIKSNYFYKSSQNAWQRARLRLCLPASLPAGLHSDARLALFRWHIRVQRGALKMHSIFHLIYAVIYWRLFVKLKYF